VEVWKQRRKALGRRPSPSRAHPLIDDVPERNTAPDRRALPDGRGLTALPHGERHPGLAGTVLRLQRTAGNRAVAGLLRPPTVQRHNSWEHALLGDTDPRRLGDAAVSNASRKHVIASEWERMKFFQNDPFRDPTARFPDIRWIRLRASGLWVSNGELNALGDYLPDPRAYDTLPASQMVAVVQKMRGMVMGSAGAEFGLHDNVMAGAADHWMPGRAGEVKALDEATASLGTNRYAGLVARNACHFAPFSWQRWALYHSQAQDEARSHFDGGRALAPLRAVDTDAGEHQRQAILSNGYADHFLQDSFAAGHLVNKTLVMQWFADYLMSLPWLSRPWLGVPTDDVLKRVGSKAQPGIAGLDRYGRPPAAGTADTDRWTERSAIDPQTAQERYTQEGRVAGSGVSGTGAEREANYQAYLTMLNSSFMQLSAGAVHDYFNQHGLLVENDNGDRIAVGGDDTMLSKSGPAGAAIAGQAAAMSRQAITDILRTGKTEWTVDRIFGFVPQRVVLLLPKGAQQTLSLAEFQTDVVHDLCVKQLFPQLLGIIPGGDSTAAEIVRFLGPELVEGGVGSTAPAPAGDYPVPVGGGRPG
jgi:hypothetical protein